MTLTIRQKLIGLTAASLLGVGVVGAIGYWGLGQLAGSLTEVETTAQALRNHQDADMMHDAIRADVLAALLSKSPDDLDAITKDLKEHTDTLAERVEANKRAALSTEINAALEHLPAPLAAYRESAEHMVALARADRAAAEAALPDFLEKFEALEGKMGDASDAIEKVVSTSTDHGHSTRDGARWAILLCAALSLATVLFIAVATMRGVLVPLALVANRLKAIAEGDGDLTVRVDYAQPDELGSLAKSFNTFAGKMNKSIAAISLAAQQLAAASEELATVNQTMSMNADEATSQANAANEVAGEVTQHVHNVSSSTEEMTVAINEIAHNASDAARVAADAVRVAGQTNEIVTRLGEASQEINKVVDTIAAVAQQTNLLALNANIEAARAGESGKGFAVVANAVKDLANQTGESTSEIRGKIESIQSQIGAVVDSISQITGVIQHINDLQASIATAVEEQSATASEMSRVINDAAAGSSRIADVLGTVTAVVQSTSTGAADGTQASNGLARMASDLQELVSQFRFSTETAHDTVTPDHHAQPSFRAPAPGGEPSALDIDVGAFANVRHRRFQSPAPSDSN